jgi:hypothetical protein
MVIMMWILFSFGVINALIVLILFFLLVIMMIENSSFHVVGDMIPSSLIDLNVNLK